jgi:hypothetical protein
MKAMDVKINAWRCKTLELTAAMLNFYHINVAVNT